MGKKQRRARSKKPGRQCQNPKHGLSWRPVAVSVKGSDDARLDTLFLAMPISWKGTTYQAPFVILLNIGT
jgi:hypothetical protein